MEAVESAARRACDLVGLEFLGLEEVLERLAARGCRLRTSYRYDVLSRRAVVMAERGDETVLFEFDMEMGELVEREA